MLEAVILDMDGLLINSEPLWHRAEISIFASVGVNLTVENCLETTGYRVDDMVKYHYDRSPWKGKSLKQVEDEIVDEVIRLIHQEGATMEGVPELFDFIKSKSLPLALCSSSHMRLIQSAVKHLNIGHHFQVLHSAEYEVYAKPHPAVYLSTAEKLGVSPLNCLAFEDSLTGLVAAKAARMKTISVPEHRTSKYDVADFVLDSLLEFNEEKWQILNQL